MGIAVGQAAPTVELSRGNQFRDQARSGFRYLGRNRQLILGLVLLGALLLFVVIGNFVYDVSHYRPLSVPQGRPPSAQYWLGTDSQGRDIMAVMIAGTPLTLFMGLLAGFLGVAVGTILAFAGAYYGGWLDALVRGVVDVGLTIPTFLVLIIVAISIHSAMTIPQMALVIAALAWLWPTRTIRAQDHLHRAHAQPAALSGGIAGRRGGRGCPRLTRARSAGAWRK